MLIGHPFIFFWEMLTLAFSLFFTWVIRFCCCWVLQVLYIGWILNLYPDIWLENPPSPHFVDYLPTFLLMFFVVQKFFGVRDFFNFDGVQFVYLLLGCMGFWVLSWFARAAITKLLWFPLRPLLLACRWIGSAHVLFSIYAHPWYLFVCPNFLFL